jgi:hypothetical protein
MKKLPRKTPPLTLHHETVRVLTTKSLAPRKKPSLTLHQEAIRVLTTRPLAVVVSGAAWTTDPSKLVTSCPQPL